MHCNWSFWSKFIRQIQNKSWRSRFLVATVSVTSDRFEFALEKLLYILNFLTQKFALQSQSLRTRHDPGTPRKRRRRSGSAEAEARRGNPPEITSPNRFNAASKTPTPAAPNHTTPLSNAQVQYPSMKRIKRHWIHAVWYGLRFTPC